jgi:hypothetical protein
MRDAAEQRERDAAELALRKQKAELEALLNPRTNEPSNSGDEGPSKSVITLMGLVRALRSFPNWPDIKP